MAITYLGKDTKDIFTLGSNQFAIVNGKSGADDVYVTKNQTVQGVNATQDQDQTIIFEAGVTLKGVTVETIPGTTIVTSRYVTINDGVNVEVSAGTDFKIGDRTFTDIDALSAFLDGQGPDYEVTGDETDPVEPSLTVTASAASVDEGDTVGYTISGEANTTYTYELAGDVDTGDVAESLTGTVTTDANGEATVTYTLNADNTTEGSEGMTFTVSDGTESVSADAVTVNDTSVFDSATISNFEDQTVEGFNSVNLLDADQDVTVTANDDSSFDGKTLVFDSNVSGDNYSFLGDSVDPANTDPDPTATLRSVANEYLVVDESGSETVIGNYDISNGKLTITFNENATAANIELAAKNVIINLDGTAKDREVEVTLDGESQGTISLEVNVDMKVNTLGEADEKLVEIGREDQDGAAINSAVYVDGSLYTQDGDAAIVRDGASLFGGTLDISVTSPAEGVPTDDVTLSVNGNTEGLDGVNATATIYGGQYISVVDVNNEAGGGANNEYVIGKVTSDGQNGNNLTIELFDSNEMDYNLDDDEFAALVNLLKQSVTFDVDDATGTDGERVVSFELTASDGHNIATNDVSMNVVGSRNPLTPLGVTVPAAGGEYEDNPNQTQQPNAGDGTALVADDYTGTAAGDPDQIDVYGDETDAAGFLDDDDKIDGGAGSGTDYLFARLDSSDAGTTTTPSQIDNIDVINLRLGEGLAANQSNDGSKAIFDAANVTNAQQIVVSASDGEAFQIDGTTSVTYSNSNTSTMQLDNLTSTGIDTIDASTFEGTLDVDTDLAGDLTIKSSIAGSNLVFNGVGTVDATGGAGVDAYDFTTTLDSNDSIDGAAGADTLAAELVDGTIAPTIANVPTVTLSTDGGTAVTSTLDLANADDIKTINITGTGHADDVVTLDNVDATVTTIDASGGAFGGDVNVIYAREEGDTDAAATITGGDGDDSFDLGTLLTTQDGSTNDQITGGNGDDTLKGAITEDFTIAAADGNKTLGVAAVENLEFTVDLADDADDKTLTISGDFIGDSGVESLTLTGGAAGETVAIADASIDGDTENVTLNASALASTLTVDANINDTDDSNTTAATLNVTGGTANDTLNLSVNSTVDTTVDADGAYLTATGVETINVEATANNAVLDVSGVADGEINVMDANGQTLTLENLNVNVDASAATDSLTATVASTDGVTITAGQGNDTLTGGDGADTFNFGENLDTNDTVDGGAGNDTLTATIPSANTDLFEVESANVENIELTLQSNQVIDVSGVTGTTGDSTLTLKGDGNATVRDASAAVGEIDASALNGRTKFIFGQDANRDIRITGANNQVDEYLLDAPSMNAGTITIDSFQTGAGYDRDQIQFTSTYGYEYNDLNVKQVGDNVEITALDSADGFKIVLLNTSASDLDIASNFAFDADAVSAIETTGDGFNTVNGTNIAGVKATADDNTIIIADADHVQGSGSTINGVGGSNTLLFGSEEAYDISDDTVSNIGTINAANATTLTATAEQLDGVTVNNGNTVVVEAVDGDENLTNLSGTVTVELANPNGTIDFTDGTNELEDVNTVDMADFAGGNDSLVLTAAQLDAVTITNEGADDTLVIDEKADTDGVTINASGFAGLSTLTGGAGADIITASVAGGTITGGAEADTLTGGAGDDKFVYAATADLFSDDKLVDTIDGGTGSNSIVIDNNGGDQFTIAANYVWSNTDNGSITNVEKITANASDNIITITANNDMYEAGITEIDLSGDTDATAANVINVSAEDGSANGYTLTGSAGADTITGGAGADTITGGANNDTIIIGDGDDAAGESYTGGADTDTLDINTTEAVDLSDDTLATLETLDLDTGTTATDVTLTGTQLNAFNTVTADGDDAITVNTLTGTVAATAATDTFVFDATDTNVAITGFTSGTDKVDLTALSLTAGTVADPTTITASNIYTITGAADAADTDAAAAAAIDTALDGTGTLTDASDGDVAYFTVVDDNSSAIYKYTAANGSTGVADTELTLVGTFDAQIAAADFVLA